MTQKFTVMLKDRATYEKYKQEVIAGGGTIVHDHGFLQGFTAEIPDTVLYQWKSFVGSDILALGNVQFNAGIVSGLLISG
ncbi:hypothetical protein HYDPIDRAFT_107172 [Hydnomerulius pinastri MD-312]|nr:hypothetical protein HYDPIDRAFT_107172 [Hydnomerulius pinastri MD-312]